MKPANPKASLRCAVYTRVSTEHGLEQEFNSLDNQREASEAYIKSQAHDSITILTDGCTNFRKFLVEGTRPNLKKIGEYVERSLMLVTALSPVIGYDKASKIAHYALDNDLTLKAAACTKRSRGCPSTRCVSTLQVLCETSNKSGNAYRLTQKGVQVALLFLFFQKRLCGPLANSRFHHRPNPQHRPNSRLEAAYHRADAAIQRVVDLLAAA